MKILEKRFKLLKSVVYIFIKEAHQLELQINLFCHSFKLYYFFYNLLNLNLNLY